MTEMGVWRFLVTGGLILPVEVFRSGRWFVALGCYGGGPCSSRSKNPRRAILAYARRWMGIEADRIEEIVEPGQRLRAEVEYEVKTAREERDRAYTFERDALTALGAVDAKMRLLARMVIEARLSSAGEMATDIVCDEAPAILDEMRQSTPGRAGIKGWPVEMLARALGEEIGRVDAAKNFIEWPFRVRTESETVDFVLRAERVSGKSPGELVHDAQAKMAVLRADLETRRGKAGGA